LIHRRRPNANDQIPVFTGTGLKGEGDRLSLIRATKDVGWKEPK
jgi:hypothetical protein